MHSRFAQGPGALLDQSPGVPPPAGQHLDQAGHEHGDQEPASEEQPGRALGHGAEQGLAGGHHQHPGLGPGPNGVHDLASAGDRSSGRQHDLVGIGAGRGVQGPVELAESLVGRCGAGPGRVGEEALGIHEQRRIRDPQGEPHAALVTRPEHRRGDNVIRRRRLAEGDRRRTIQLSCRHPGEGCEAATRPVDQRDDLVATEIARHLGEDVGFGARHLHGGRQCPERPPHLDHQVRQQR